MVTDPEQSVAAIEASFPPPERMERFFELSTQLFQIRLPEKLDLELAEAGQQQEIIRVRERMAQEAGRAFITRWKRSCRTVWRRSGSRPRNCAARCWRACRPGKAGCIRRRSTGWSSSLTSSSN